MIKTTWIAALLGALTSLSAPADTLQLDKRGLQLLDAQGRELDRLNLRAKRWDQRSDAAGPLAVLLDADRGRPLLVRAVAGKLKAFDLPEPRYTVEALCLYRDPRGLLQLFLLGDEGLSEHWLLDTGAAPTAKPLRHLATPLAAKGCSVDDASGELRIDEAGVGRWVYRAEAEGKPQRRLMQAQVAPKDNSKQWLWPVVQPSAQTEPVARFGDAADDPAIWVHPRDARLSRVLGTNKKQGLLVYDLEGREKQLLEVGRLNNVDLRQGIAVQAGETLDLAVATQRDENSLLLFNIAGDGTVAELARLPTDLREIYGVCVLRTPAAQLEVVVNDKDGRVQQYRVERDDGRSDKAWRARLLRQWRVDTQPEGCVVDERRQRLFLGEEKRGIWAFDARADQPAKPQLVMGTGRELQADVEGLALYQGKAASYLVVSSQGNDSYLVLDAEPPFKLRGGFRIGINAQLGIDGTSETDGLEVSSANFGGVYGQGLLVVQDGHKRLPDGPQNFKLVPWSDIAKVLKLPLD